MKLLRCSLVACTVASAAGAQLRPARLAARTLAADVRNVSNGDALFIQDKGTLDSAVALASVRGQEGVDAAVGSMVMDLLKGRGTSLGDIVKVVNSKMTLQDAVQRLGDKMPEDIAALVRVAHSTHTQGKGNFSEDSLQKARRILNGMVEASLVELDDAIIDCEEFKRSNRKTFDQVVTDLARLGSEIADAEEKVAENMGCVASQDGEFKSIAESLQSEEQQYMKTRAADDQELTLKKNDLAVFNFIMDITKCQDAAPNSTGGLFVQVGANQTAPVRVCSTNSGFELDFKDARVQAKVDSMMTPAARLALRAALGVAFAGKTQQRASVQHRALLQTGGAKTGAPLACATLFENTDYTGWQATFALGTYNLTAFTAQGGKAGEASALKVNGTCKVTLYQEGNLSGASASFTEGSYNQGDLAARGVPDNQVSAVKVEMVVPTSAPSLTAKPIAVKEEPAPEQQWKKCSDGKPDCGLLHDTMSLQWGKFKDLVDELQSEMRHNQDEWDRLKTNLNEQLKVITGQKGDCQTKFDQAVGTKNTLTEERNQKDQQHRELTEAYEGKMAVCKARIDELLFTDVCAVRTVRNQVLKESTVSPPLNITDCDLGDWAAEPCSVECDDTCPHMVGRAIDPYSCGGWMTLNRVPIVNANQFGIKCPALTRKSRCGQFKCSVDCVQSEWSGWSKCTKECEGGAQQMTRSILTKPKHGGEECASTVETRACNTGSCDRDCTLNVWTAWSPCSMACNPGDMPGFQERTRSVLVPIRGEGRCPAVDHVTRYAKQTCNEQPCNGDEICIAKQDLIIAIDASGSMREKGFQVVRDFAGNLTTRYKSMYLGAASVQIGVILFGNGARQSDDTIAPAIPVAALTADLPTVAKAIKETTWQKGFTNMAQAFVLADTMLQQGGRADAQSAVLVLSDGKYSFAFETEKAVNALKAKNTMIFMAPVAPRPGNWEPKIKHWASQPWETNYELIPGVLDLANNMGVFASALVAKFCSNAVSPYNSMLKEEGLGFMLVHEGGLPDEKCAQFVDMGYVATVRECRLKAEQDMGMMAFAVGARDGAATKHCYAESIAVTSQLWAGWQSDKTNILCPGGNWTANPMYDTYVIEPMGMD